MLHDVQLAQPRLVKRVARCVYDVAQPVLFREHQHRIKQRLHRVDGVDQRRPNRARAQRDQSLSGTSTGSQARMNDSQLVRLVNEEDGDLLRRRRARLALLLRLVPRIAVHAPLGSSVVQTPDTFFMAKNDL